MPKYDFNLHGIPLTVRTYESPAERMTHDHPGFEAEFYIEEIIFPDGCRDGESYLDPVAVEIIEEHIKRGEYCVK